MSTPKSPLPQIARDKKPEKSGLTIGILCGVLGFFVVIVICIIVILKFRRKKKTRDEKVQCSNAQLLTDSQNLKDVKGKYDVPPLSGQKSLSCPDIYAVNKSILLKLGSTAHAYEQLEQESIKGAGAKSKSEDYVLVRSASDEALHNTFSKVSGDERDGRIFDDEGQLYQTPSMLNTFRRKSRDRTHTSKDSSRDFLHPEDVTLPVQGGMSDGTNDHDACVTGYRVPSSTSPNLKLNTNVRSGYSSETDKKTEVVGYQSPTSNSPIQIPKSRSFNAVPLRNNASHLLDEEDNIYDVPKLEDRDQIYTNLPAELLGSRGNQIRDDCYKTPVHMENPRSYTMGSTVRKKAHDRDRVYEVPSSTSYHSQPSLEKMTSDEKRNAIAPRDMTDGFGDNFYDDNTYDVPSQFRAGDSGVENSSKIRDIINSMRDNNYLVDNIVDNSASNNNTCTKTRNGDHEPGDVTRETAYDVPHNVAPSAFSPIDNDDPYKNVSPSQETPRNARLFKKLGYDVPSTIPVFDPSQPSLLKLASKNLYPKFDGSDMTYDVPSASIPDFDPSLAYSRRPLNKKINNNDNRSKQFEESLIYVDESDLVYDIPSSRDQTTTEILPTATSYSENKELSSRDDSDEYTHGDAIYQNVFQSEDGRTHLRTYVPSSRP